MRARIAGANLQTRSALRNNRLIEGGFVAGHTASGAGQGSSSFQAGQGGARTSVASDISVNTFIGNSQEYAHNELTKVGIRTGIGYAAGGIGQAIFDYRQKVGARDNTTNTLTGGSGGGGSTGANNIGNLNSSPFKLGSKGFDDLTFDDVGKG